MTVGFSTIPADLKIPLFWAEFSNSQATAGVALKRSLIIGQTITVVPSVLTYVSGGDQAGALFGTRSQLAAMVAAYRKNDPFGELWVLPLPDAGASVAATVPITVAGTATAAGVISLYVAGRLISVPVAAGSAAAAVATAIAAAVTAATDVPVTAAAAAAVATLTAANKGALGNDLDVRHSYGGTRAGEALPAGITLTIPAASAGATDPDLTTLDPLLADEEFEVIVAPYAGTTQLDALKTLMNDVSGRWSWLRQIYGHVYSAKRGTAAALLTFGQARNDQHVTVLGYPADNPTPPWVRAAALGAQASVSTRADPARPMQTLPLVGVLASPPSSRFLRADQQALLSAGIALEAYAPDGSVSILRAVTTYQKNVFGSIDRSYLDAETMHLLGHVVRELRTRLQQRFPRHKLASDGTRFGFGQPIVTPKAIKAELLAQYAEMEELGLVENVQLFGDATIVERNATDPSRVDILYAPDLVNGLRVLATLVQFRS